MRPWLLVFIAVAVLVPGSVRAQDVAPAAPASEPGIAPTIAERFGLTGSVRAGYWSSTRTLDAERHLAAGMLWLKSSRRLTDHVSFLAEGWTSWRGPLDEDDAGGELREAFLDLKFGRLDLRAGRQIIAWGRADGVNPTDNVSGQDLRLLVPDESDRRLGTTAVRASYYVSDVSLTGVWLPEFRGHEFALPAPPAGVTFVREDDRWPGDQWAVRVEQTGRAVDWSVSFFRGKDMAPDLGIATAVPGLIGPGVLLSHHRVRVYGADMAANLGRFGLRAEGAYVETDDTRGTDPFTKNPFFFIVAGGDRTWRGLLNLNVQYLYRRVLDDPQAALSPGMYRDEFTSKIAMQQAVLNTQTQAVQHGASFRIAYKWLHETLEGELAAAAYASPRGATMRPKITYAVTDHWKLVAGAELFRGETASLFGLLRPNSDGYFEVRRSF